MKGLGGYVGSGARGVLLAWSLAVCAQPATAPAQAVQSPAAADELFSGLNQFVPAEVDEVSLQVSDAATHAVLAGSSGRPELVARLDFLRERIFYYDHPGRYSQAAVEAYRSKLADPPWQCLLRTRSPDLSVDLCERMGIAGGVHGMAEIKVTKLGLLFLHARGRLSLAQLDEVSRLAAPADVRKYR